MVDEYQDTKEIQYGIVAEIIKAGHGRVKSFIVGDPNQAIYGSLGGYAISASEFQIMGNIDQREMSLSLNYRSSSRIVDYFSNYNVYDTTISAAGELREFPSTITFDTLTKKSGLVETLTQHLRHKVEVEGVPPDEICILAPQWVFLASMTRSLMAALPEYGFDGPGMVPFTRDIDNFWYKLTRIILSEPSPSMYVRRLRWAGEIISSLKDANVNISGLSARLLLRECNSIYLTEQDGLTYLEQFFDQLFERMNIDFRIFPFLVEHHDAFFSSSRSRIQRIQKEGTTFINEIGAFRKVFESRSGITVSTIHGIKGGEFDSVIAYALLEGLVPHSGDSNDSAKKLLYVIGSRARKHLHLISERGRQDRYTRTERTPTKALNSCSFNYDSV